MYILCIYYSVKCENSANCSTSHPPTEIKRLRIEHPIVFTVDIRYNKGIEFVCKLALHLHVFGIYESLPTIL